VIVDHISKARAIQVRDQHLGGRTCPECPPSPFAGRCELLATWNLTIYQIGAARHVMKELEK
jgi:hypothetical protein